jgi:hypothetical protein
MGSLGLYTAQAEMLVHYDFGGPSAEEGTLAASYEAANITGLDVSAGPSLTSAEFKDNTGGTPAYYTAENWEYMLNANKYFQFAVTVAPGYSMDVASVALSMFKKSGKAPDLFRIRYSLNGTTFNDFGNPQSADYEDQWHDATVSYPLVALSGTVYFRIYGYDANGADKRWRIDDVTLNGTVYSGSTNPPSLELAPSGTSKTTEVGERIEFTVTATEVDGDTITLTGENLPANCVFKPNPSTALAPIQRTFQWNPACTGIYDVVFQAADEDGTNTTTVTIKVTPARPEIELILNEANGVGRTKYLGSDFFGENNCNDSFFGRIEGNGGNWMELVVVKDHADLRGWQLCWAEPGDPISEPGITNWVPTGEDCWFGGYYGVNGATVKQGVVTFSDDILWSDLRAGTIITIIESVMVTNQAGALCLNGSDTDIDVRSDDWWIHVSTLDEATQGTPLLTSTSNITGENPGEFVVGNDNWELMIKDNTGRTAFVPVGEGVPDWTGGSCSSVEGMFAKSHPHDILNVNYYDDTKWTSFGSHNVWDEGGDSQDFSTVRSAVMVPPAMEALGDWTAVVGSEFIFTIDVEPTDGDSIYLHMTSGPPGASFTTNATSGEFRWTPAVAGKYNASFAAIDQDGTESQSVSIYVVDPPSPSDIVINELFVNPVGTDDAREYIELKGSPGASLNGLTLLMLDSAGAGIGDIELVCPLTGYSLGANGLMILGENYDSTSPYSLPADTTRVDLPVSEDLRDEATYLLVQNFSGSLGDDLDGLDIGELDYTPWSAVIDGVGMTEPTDGFKIYCDARLTMGGRVADACSRLPGNSNSADSSAWYYGGTESVINDPWGLTYNPDETSGPLPPGAVLTPGAENIAGTDNPDADGDGLPDDWELQMSGSTDMTAEGDYDGDRFSNYGEYVAGTHAGDSNSVFTLSPDGFTSSAFVLSWNAVTGRTYSVRYCEELITDEWLTLAGADNLTVSVNRVYSITNQNPSSTLRLYHVRVELTTP